MAAQPKSKYDNFIELINALVLDKGPLLDTAALLAEAKKIEAYSYIDSKMALGMVYAIECNEPEVKRQFTAALSASGNDTLVQSNYASAMINIHRPFDAVQLISDVIKTKPNDVTVLLRALEVYLAAQDLEHSKEVVDTLSKLGFPLDKIKAENMEFLKNLTRFYSSNEASWEDVAKRIEFVGSIINGLGTKLIKTDVFHTIDGVIMKFILNCKLEETLEIQNNIIEELSKLPYVSADDMLSFACVPYEC